MAPSGSGKNQRGGRRQPTTRQPFFLHTAVRSEQLLELVSFVFGLMSFVVLEVLVQGP